MQNIYIVKARFFRKYFLDVVLYFLIVGKKNGKPRKSIRNNSAVVIFKWGLVNYGFVTQSSQPPCFLWEVLPQQSRACSFVEGCCLFLTAELGNNRNLIFWTSYMALYRISLQTLILDELDRNHLYFAWKSLHQIYPDANEEARSLTLGKYVLQMITGQLAATAPSVSGAGTESQY